MDKRTDTLFRYHWSVPKQLLFSLIIVAAFLSLAEGAVRVWAHYFRTSYERYNSTTGRFELVPNIRFIDRRGAEFLINSRGFVGAEFEQVPPPNTVRIISLGDSCTFTIGHWRDAYPFVLQELLNKQATSPRYEVINAGIEGYNSTYALARLKEELLDFRPHVVTIYVGWNDLMKENPSSEESTGKYSFVGELFESSYLAKAYKKLLFVYLRPLLFRPNTDPAINQEELRYYDGYVPNRFRNNLEAMINVLRERRIVPVLFTLPTVVSLGMTDEQIKRQGVFFPYYAGSFSLGRFLSLLNAYNEAIREVGQRHGVLVVELHRVFESQDKSRLFWDTMHPSERGNVLVGKTVFEALQASGVLKGKP